MRIARRACEVRVAREGPPAGRQVARFIALLAFVVALFSFAAEARGAEPPPLTDPFNDAAEADLIVEGRIVGDDRVAVERTYFPSTPDAATQREITVRGLARHERDLAPADGASGGEIANVRVLLLLKKGDRAAEWKPLGLRLAKTPAGADGTYTLTPDGAAGTYWIVGDRVWGYGPASKMRGTGLGRWPDTAERLRSEVSLGVAARRAWEEDLAVADPAEKARRLVRWLPGAPGGERLTRRQRAVPEEILQLGAAPAVPALVAALGEKEGSKRFHYEVLHVLGRLGPAAQAAVPRLLEFAASPAGTESRRSVAYALAGTRDARALPLLRAFLAEAPLSDGVTLSYAANGLVSLGDPEAADRIVARLPDSLGVLTQTREGKQSVQEILWLLEALERVDPQRMRAWLRPRASDPFFTNRKDSVEKLLRGDERPAK